MANYKDIKGFQIQTVAADPVPGSAAWSSGGNVNEARYSVSAGGTVSAAWIASGYAPSIPGVSVNHEQYNGTAWTELANLANGRNGAGGAGTTTAALVMGGYLDPGFSSNTESWNGSSWTELANLTTSRYGAASFGLQPAAIFVGGLSPPSHAAVALCEQWNGSAWTEVGNINNASGANLTAGTGTTTAGIVVGGTVTEQWNGTGWTEVADLNTARTSGMNSGTSTVCIYAGGPGTPRSAAVEAFDGTSWTIKPSMTTGRTNAGTGHTSSSADSTFVAAGSIGGSPDSTNVTEEWGDDAPYAGASVVKEGQMWYNSTEDALKVYGTAPGVPAGVWSSGGALNTGRAWLAGAGTTPAGLVFGGVTSPSTATQNLTESYNGTAWTEVADLNTARKQGSRGGGGSQTAGLYAGGDTANGSQTAVVEKWDGTSWTEIADINTARRLLAGAGTQTSNIVAGGDTSPSPSVSALVESWNGSSWTETTNINTARKGLAGAGGSNTAALVFGGDTDPTTHALTELWNGSTWTEVADLNTDRRWIGSQGSSTSALGYGGYTPGAPAGGYAVTELWNGSAWSEVADLGTGRSAVAGASGTTGAASGFCAGGDIYPDQVQTVTEEWTVSAAITTVTVS